MSHYKKLAGETMIYGLGTIVPRFLNFIVLTPFFTRVLTRSEYGLFTEIYAYSYLLLIILSYGTETGYFKFANDKQYTEKKVYGNIFSMLLFTTLIFLVVANLMASSVADWIQFGGNDVHIRIFIAIMVFDVLSTIPFAKMRQEKKILQFSLIKILNVVVNIGGVVFLLLVVVEKDWGKEFLIRWGWEGDKLTLILFSNMFASFITFLALSKEMLKAKIEIKTDLAKKILLYSSPLLISGIAGALNETLDKILLRFLVDENTDAYALLGVYNASYKLAVIIILFIQMFRFAAEPYFFSIEKEKDARVVYGRILNYFFIFVVFILLLVVFYLDFFKFYIGEDMRDGLFVVPIVLFANVLFGLLININFWYKLSGNTKWAIVIVGFGAMITVIGNIVMVPRYGIVGCAWSHVFSYGGMLLLSFFLGRKYYRINYDLKRILFYSVLASVIFVIGFFVNYEFKLLEILVRTLMLLFFIWMVERKEGLLKGLKR
jgi:O-antigen/teichoic acid export membrane protein